MIQPPVIGPTIGATTVTIDSNANAILRLLVGKITNSSV